jgi:hypothetical protein
MKFKDELVKGEVTSECVGFVSMKVLENKGNHALSDVGPFRVSSLNLECDFWERRWRFGICLIVCLFIIIF